VARAPAETRKSVDVRKRTRRWSFGKQSSSCRASSLVVRGFEPGYACSTKKATAEYWQATAAITSTWKTSWKPNTAGYGSGRRNA
jgi:hypothetical protein